MRFQRRKMIDTIQNDVGILAEVVSIVMWVLGEGKLGKVI